MIIKAVAQLEERGVFAAHVFSRDIGSIPVGFASL